MRQKPDMPFIGLWNLSFGFFGVQIAYALQSANISRIFATLGADPHNLSYFWVLPPLMGILVQPIIGTLSDRTWCRLGRRIPYLFIGAAVAVIVMCLLPNAGSFGMAVPTAMAFGVAALMFLDTSINMAMQPFKMLVGDMVNEKQKALAYFVQSFLCNAGSLVGFVFPFVFTFIGIANTAPAGIVPDSVIYSFYVGAAILISCVVYTTVKVKEWPPEVYDEYNGVSGGETTADDDNKAVCGEAKGGNGMSGTPGDDKTGGAAGGFRDTDKAVGCRVSWIRLLRCAPSAFWRVGLVQFFCWAAFMYMWTYTVGTIADTCWGTADPSSQGYQDAGNWVGVLFAVQAAGSVVWAMILPRFKDIKIAYSSSLIIGGIGFASVPFIGDQYALFVPFLCIGCAWAAMLAMPFTIVTNALQGYGHMGVYLGLFNGTICVPQIVAALLGGVVLRLVGSVQGNMMIVAGVLLVTGAMCVFAIGGKSTETDG